MAHLLLNTFHRLRKSNCGGWKKMESESLISHFLFLSLEVTASKCVFDSFQKEFIYTYQEIYYIVWNVRCFSTGHFLVLP